MVLEAIVAVAAVACVVLRLRSRAHQAPSTPVGSSAVVANRPGRSRTWRSPWIRRLLWLLVPALIVTAGISVAGQWGTLDAAIAQLAHLHWAWVRVALYAEALSIIAFACIVWTALRAGGRRLGLGSMVSLSLASNALANTIPGGPAWAATFSFGQLRRRAVDRTLAACSLVFTLLMSTVALIVLLAIGVETAGSTGPAAPFRLLVVGLVLGAAALALLGIVVRLRPAVRASLIGTLGRLPVGRVDRLAARVRSRTPDLAGVRCAPRMLAAAFAAALVNWVTDCACLVASILAVGGHVPWSGVLVAYAIGQVAENLPISPGGIGVVEGTLSVLLVAYGMPSDTALSAVLLYRIISFWILVPIGWMTAASLVLLHRGEHTPAPSSAPLAVRPPRSTLQAT
jgi:putative heme transporter